MNDFSKFSWPTFGGNQIYGQSNFAVSADQLGTSHLSDWSIDTPSYSQDNTAIQTPQRLSVASVDQPALTHSPSNTVSEAGSSAYLNEMNYANFGTPQPPTVNHSFNSSDYFGPQGLGTVSENVGDVPNDPFIYRMESASSTDDFFGGPGPAEPVIKSESPDYGVNDTFATSGPFSSPGSGTSLVVPEFTSYVTASDSFGQFAGPTTAGQP